MIVGIDPGLKGGICFPSGMVSEMPLDQEGKICPISLMAKVRVAELAHNDKGGAVYIERVGSRPGQGVRSMWNFGYGCGIIYGTFMTLGYKVVYVTPQKWKKEVLGNTYAHDKEGAIAWCGVEYPGINLIRPRCRTPHDGIADSVAIWHYGCIVES